MVGYFENLFRTLRRRISRSEWIAALLGLSMSRNTANKPGLVLIQIDGLARDEMERAIMGGRMPFLRRLHERENYEIKTFYSGVPSSTPAVQAELLYGARDAVPAFSFLNRDARSVFAMFDSECVKEVESEVSRKGAGLLKDGSSWCNIYTGGAVSDESHFCASRLAWRDLFTKRKVLHAITFPFVHFLSFAWIVCLCLWEFATGIVDIFYGVCHGESLNMEIRTLCSRIFLCVALREAMTTGIKIDVARGLPVVHVNFMGYDVHAHRRGPSSNFAHRALPGIDTVIRRIYRAAQRSARRDYQVWIYSDHGQETTRFFSHNKKHIGHLIADLMDGFNNNGRNRNGRGRPCVWRHSGDRMIDGYKKLNGKTEPWFSAAAMGPVGHVYLLHPRAQSQRLKLAGRLVENGVPGALICNNCGHLEWLEKGRRLTLPDELPDLPHIDGTKAELVHDLVRLCAQKFSGDIILLGWNSKQAPVSFVDEHGAHAGPGPKETRGFCLLPPSTKLPDRDKEFIRPADLRAAALHFLGRQSLRVSASRARRENRNVRVMTYNVHGCRGMDGRVSPLRIARIIERYNPDIVALQELDFGRVRSERHDQPQLIAAALGMNVQFCPTLIDDDEQYGHALLSRLPMDLVQTATFRAGGRRWHVEPRGALWVRMELNGMPVNLMNTHFGLGRQERLAQMTELLGEGWIGKITDDNPLVLCGDFNMFPGSRPYRAIAQRLQDVQGNGNKHVPKNTFTTFHPFARIDHVFISRHFAVEKVLVPRNDLTRVASDHLPLIVDLNFKNVPKPGGDARDRSASIQMEIPKHSNSAK